MRSGIRVLYLALVACSSSSNSIHGTVHGQTIEVANVISSVVTIIGAGAEPSAVIVMGSSHTLCADVTGQVAHPNEQLFLIVLTDDTPTTTGGYTTAPPTAPGTYTVDNANTLHPMKRAALLLFVKDGMCNDASELDAIGTDVGTVELTGVDGDKFSGHFDDVPLDSGDRISGTFDPEPCPALCPGFNVAPTICR